MSGKAELRNLREVFRDGMVESDRIAAVLRGGPRTLPEIARALGAPDHEVTKWLMAMRRYGRVHELPKARADDYYQYELTGAPP
jgi:hypothetical protein